MIKHKIVTRLTWLVSATATVAMLLLAVRDFHEHTGTGIFVFVWRWPALAIVAAIIAIISNLFVFIRRSTGRNGSYIWFCTIMISGIAYLLFLLGQISGATPEVAAFWQGMLPLGWIPSVTLLLLFVLSVVDDNDTPLNLNIWVVVTIFVPVLTYVSGFTDIVEAHTPINSTLEWWGYQNTTGGYNIIVSIWAAVMWLSALGILFRAYRNAIDSNRKRQLRLFLIAVSQNVIIAVAIDFILYSLNPHIFPPMSPVYITVLCLVLSYGILKYGLFQINPTRLAATILQNLSEAVIGVNSELRVEFSNKGATNIFGYDEASFRGMDSIKLFSPASVKRVQEALLTSGDNAAFDNIEAINSSGEVVPVSTVVSKLKNDHDKEVGYIIVVQNISELKKKSLELAEEKANVELRVIERTKELHDERAKLKASIASLVLGFMLVDLTGKISIKNGVIDKIFENQKFDDVSNVEHLLHDFPLAKYCLEVQEPGARPVHKEISFNDKVLRVFIAGVKSDTDETSASLGAVILVEDITEVKVLERSRDEFFSIASHELRTPLTAIRGNASMILEYYNESIEKEVKEVITDIHDSSIRLIDIVNDFLDLSRLEQGKVSFEYKECELDKIIESVVYEMKGSIREKKIAVKFEGLTLGELPKVWADPVRAKQVVYNLISNAIKFTDEGIITISPMQEQKLVKVYITDTGRGITLKSRSLLFHKFQQAGESILTRDTTRGTGLGLYISRLMTEAMGGKVELERSVEGKGSTFSFSLPIATTERKKHHTKKLYVDPSSGLTVTDK